MGQGQNDPSLAQAGFVRTFVQRGVGNPTLPYGYMGCAEFDKPTQDLGPLEPVYCPSSTQRNAWDIVDVISRTPGLPKVDILQHASRFLTDVWIGIRNQGCLFNTQAVFSKCGRPDDFIQSWDSKILFGRAKLTKIDFGNLNPLDGTKNEIVDITGSLESQIMAFIYPMAFQEAGSVTVVAEVVDGFYYDAITCGDCGSVSDGCQLCYGLQVSNPGSPGLSSQLLYSSDGGATWSAMDIPTLGGVSARRFAPMGTYCIVVSPNSLAYHYALLSDIQAGTVNWSSQASGFVAGKSPMCIAVKNSGLAFIGAQGGYIYQLTGAGNAVTVLSDGSVSTQNVNDIAFFGQIVVAVGDNNAIWKSVNNGQSWSLVVGPLVGQSLSTIWCINANNWFVGTGNGKLYLTTNGGSTWTQRVFDGSTNLTTIDDIQFYDENVGYMAAEVGGAGRVYRTTDGGNTWQYTGSAISGIPTNQRIDVVAPCGYNTVMAVGRKTIGGDGLIAIAKNPNLN